MSGLIVIEGVSVVESVVVVVVIMMRDERCYVGFWRGHVLDCSD